MRQSSIAFSSFFSSSPSLDVASAPLQLPISAKEIMYVKGVAKNLRLGKNYDYQDLIIKHLMSG